MPAPTQRNIFAGLADKVPVPAPPKLSWLGLRHILLIAAGSVVFLVVNVYLYLGRCTTTEFMIDCNSGDGSDWVFVVGTVGILALGAVVSRLGRMFAMGFAGMFLCLTVVTAGACVTPWLDPYYVAKRRYDQTPARAAKLRTERDHRAWVEAQSKRAMDLERGVEMAGAISACVKSRADTNRRVPAKKSEVSKVCDRQDDGGWRWTYTPDAGGFDVEVLPDESLPHKYPRVIASSDGRINVMLAPDKPPFLVLPVDDLRQLAGCLRRVPTMFKSRPGEPAPPPSDWDLTRMSNHLCGALGPKLRAATPNDARSTLLAVMMPAGTAGESAARLATYRVKFNIRQPANDPFAFDLTATPLAGGLPRYLVTFEGTVHRTMDIRDATVSDPVVAVVAR